MLRVLLTVALAAGFAAGVAWYFNLLPAPNTGIPDGGGGPDQEAQVDLGELLYAPAPEAPKAQGLVRTGHDPIPLPGCHFLVVHKADIPSQKDGPLSFVGQELPPENAGGPNPAPTAEIRVGSSTIRKAYRPLERDDIILPGQMVALVNPALALADLDVAHAKKVAAAADYDSAVATYNEAQARLDRAKKLLNQGPQGLISQEEYGAAILYRDRYREDAVSKREAKKVAEIEIEKARTVYQQHAIYNDTGFTGVVKTVYKKRDEAVKAQEPVLQLYDIEHLRAEGLAGVQFLSRLKRGARVTLEPTAEEGPLRRFLGHKGEIHSVAVTGRGSPPRIVSGSEDRDAFVWSLNQPDTPRRVLRHPDAVRVVACTPPAFAHNWCLTGCADGSLRLWDLDGPDTGKPLRVLQNQGHRGAVTALAFSPDGKFFASGGEDSMIYLWETESPGEEPLYPQGAGHGVEHQPQGAITALHFTPEARLVSAARDHSLRVWSLHQRGARPAADPILSRTGTVAALGVSPDGGRMLLDQGGRLQVLSVPAGDPLASLESPFGAIPFETLALFSPDARPEESLLLTAGAPEGRLQLWRTPGPHGRAFEVRQFTPRERSPVTCAAFAPYADRSRGALSPSRARVTASFTCGRCPAPRRWRPTAFRTCI
jgi:WD40 repeat protein